MKVSVMGTGYVGLVAGTCFADAGHEVTCVDADPRKIESLQQGQIPIHEPGLSEVVLRNVEAGRLAFATEPGPAIEQSEVVFCAVGTPPTARGDADLGAVFEVARTVARFAAKPTLLVLKSTVPVRTNERVTALLEELGAKNVEVVSNPEFLKEGAALEDFMRPERVVVGVRSARAAEVMRRLYGAFLKEAPLFVMDPPSAELTKYAANAMLATRISFMNAVASLCETVGADVEAVRRAVGADRRIGPAFLAAGVGYGGSCFPKDVQALAASARELGEPMPLLDEVEHVNARQKQLLVRKIERAFETIGGLSGRTIALWGLAFKPDTDDLRESPSLTIIEGLIAKGARVRVHDPVAMPRAKELLASHVAAGHVDFCTSPYEALEGADALAIATAWADYRRPDFDRIRAQLSNPWIFDGRNLWEAREVAALGLVYRSIGRPDASPPAREK